MTEAVFQLVLATTLKPEPFEFEIEVAPGEPVNIGLREWCVVGFKTDKILEDANIIREKYKVQGCNHASHFASCEGTLKFNYLRSPHFNIPEELKEDYLIYEKCNYNFEIDWGDGSKEKVDDFNDKISHAYTNSEDAIYTIKIRGLYGKYYSFVLFNGRLFS